MVPPGGTGASHEGGDRRHLRTALMREATRCHFWDARLNETESARFAAPFFPAIE